MLNGFRILLFIVLLLGIVLISGYTYLMFGDDITSKSVESPVPSVGTSDSVASPFVQKSRTYLEVELQYSSLDGTTLPHVETPSSNPMQVPNRTEEAGNKDIVIFNRVPKTGSEMFEKFGIYLASIFGYHAYIDPQIMTLFPSKQDDKNFVTHFNKEVAKDAGIYFRHMTYFDFGSQPRPIYVSVVRHPVDRMVSWFYYQRWKDRPDDRNPVEVCAKNTKWTSFCGQMEAIRQRDLDQKNQEWDSMTFDQCVEEKKLPDCVFNEGSGYLLQKDFMFDFRSQMMFFCGNTMDCSLFNSPRVLNKAKTIAEEKYSVIGILEDLESTFSALQAYVPKFFRNAKKIFNENESNLTLTHTNKNPIRKPISNQTRTFLEKKFSVEIEFYEFCKQRLHNQLKSLEKSVEYSDNSNSWPDQVAMNEIVPVDDYVLL